MEGTTLTLTANVSPTAPGTYEFFDQGNSLGAASSSATKTHSPGVGNHSYTVQFVPTNLNAFVGSTSTAKVVDVATTSLTVTPSSSQVDGTLLTLAASVSRSC